MKRKKYFANRCIICGVKHSNPLVQEYDSYGEPMLSTDEDDIYIMYRSFCDEHARLYKHCVVCHEKLDEQDLPYIADEGPIHQRCKSAIYWDGSTIDEARFVKRILELVKKEEK